MEKLMRLEDLFLLEQKQAADEVRLELQKERELRKQERRKRKEADRKREEADLMREEEQRRREEEQRRREEEQRRREEAEAEVARLRKLLEERE